MRKKTQKNYIISWDIQRKIIKKSTITFKDTNHSFYNTILNGLRSIANLNKFVLIFVMNDKITPAFILPPPSWKGDLTKGQNRD